MYFSVSGVILSTPEAYRSSSVNLSLERDTITDMRNSHVQHGVQKHVLLHDVSSEAEPCPAHTDGHISIRHCVQENVRISLCMERHIEAKRNIEGQKRRPWGNDPSHPQTRQQQKRVRLGPTPKLTHRHFRWYQ